MNNDRYDILEAYRNKILSEDGGGMANPPTSSAANAPAGAMSSGPYLDQFHENPKLAVYNHPTRKKKVFTREEDLEEFLKENPEWSKEPFEESQTIEEGKTLWSVIGTKNGYPIMVGVYDHKDSAFEDAENYKKKLSKKHDDLIVFESPVNGTPKEILNIFREK